MEDDGRYEYEYDNEGNLIHRYDSTTAQVLTFKWDNRNRLVEIIEGVGDPEFRLAYDYDTFNRRVARSMTVTSDGGEEEVSTTTAEKFIYDGDHVVLDFFKPDGGSFGLARRYLYGPAVDQVLAQENVAKSISDPARVYWMLTVSEKVPGTVSARVFQRLLVVRRRSRNGVVVIRHITNHRRLLLE